MSWICLACLWTFSRTNLTVRPETHRDLSWVCPPCFSSTAGQLIRTVPVGTLAARTHHYSPPPPPADRGCRLSSQHRRRSSDGPVAVGPPSTGSRRSGRPRSRGLQSHVRRPFGRPRLPLQSLRPASFDRRGNIRGTTTTERFCIHVLADMIGPYGFLQGPNTV